MPRTCQGPESVLLRFGATDEEGGGSGVCRRRRGLPGVWKREPGESRCRRRTLVPRTCQGPESVLLYRSGLTMASSVSGFLERLTRKEVALGCVGEEEAGSESGGDTQKKAGAEEGVGPVSIGEEAGEEG